MQNEYQAMRLVTKIAENDVRIRTVVMSSAARIPFPSAELTKKVDETVDFRLADKHFPLKDVTTEKTNFDIIYLVTDLDSLITADFFVSTFGERKCSDIATTNDKKWVKYILPLISGNQITLHVVESNHYEKKDNALIEIIMDKDNIFPEERTPSDITYWEKSQTLRRSTPPALNFGGS